MVRQEGETLYSGNCPVRPNRRGQGHYLKYKLPYRKCTFYFPHGAKREGVNIGTLPLVDSPFPANNGWTPACPWREIQVLVLQLTNRNAISGFSEGQEKVLKTYREEE